MIALALAGLGIAFEFVTVDLPIYFRFMYADFPDPEHPGHLKGVTVSTPELLVHAISGIGCLALAVWLFLCLRKSDA